MSPIVELFAKDSLPLKINEIRVIPYTILSGKLNMAIDHYFAAKNVSISEAVIRFYGWHPECISLGYHQELNILNNPGVQAENIDIIRRPTGGSAVFHCEELTYSIVISKNILNHHDLYLIIHKIIADSLIKMGYNVYLEDSKKEIKTDICYNRTAKSEIKYKNKKVVGSAQRLYPATILQHGSILFSNKQLQIVNFLNYNKEEMEYYKNMLKDNSVSLKDIVPNDPINKSYLMNSIIEQFQNIFTGMFYYKNITNPELEKIKIYEKSFEIE